MFKYFAFGLKIISDLDLPELIESQFEEYDLRITVGEIPPVAWDENSLHKPIVSIDKNNFLHKLPPATYLASNGSRTFIAPNPGQDFDSIRLFLYSNIFAAIMHQRNYLLIHASGVVYKEKLHLFLGASGMGKSTIVAFLEKKGYEIYSDDIILFKLTDGELTTCQTYPQIKLWEDTFDKLGIKKFLFEPIAGDGFSAYVSKGLSSPIAKSVSEKDPQMIAFLQDIIIVRNAYYLQQSGKAVTGGEAARNFFASIQPTDSASVLQQKSKRAKEEISHEMTDLENTLRGLAPQQAKQTNKPITNKTYSVGEIIERNGKKYKVTDISNPSDPDMEEVP
jgi:hypothetical protein